jgi:hypothetical protein
MALYCTSTDNDVVDQTVTQCDDGSSTTETRLGDQRFYSGKWLLSVSCKPREALYSPRFRC